MPNDEELTNDIGNDESISDENNEQSNDTSDDNAGGNNSDVNSNTDEPIDEPSEEELEIEEFKKYARIDYNDDDNLIRVLLEAAKNYIKRATGKIYDATNKLHVLLKNLLVLHWYENRQAVVALSPNEVPFTIKNLLTFLQMTTDDEPEDTQPEESPTEESLTEEGE